MTPSRILLPAAACCLLTLGCATNRAETTRTTAEAPTSQPAADTTDFTEAALPPKSQAATPESVPAYERGTVADDRAVMREALQGMESADREDVNTRLNLVRELGLYSQDGAPQPGDTAPDFELAPLRFYDFQVDETPITKENADSLYQPVRLSAFRDKLPVVLIFGSYT